MNNNWQPCPICNVSIPIDQTPALCEECSNIAIDVFNDLLEFFGIEYGTLDYLFKEVEVSTAGKGRLTEDLRNLIKKRRIG